MYYTRDKNGKINGRTKGIPEINGVPVVVEELPDDNPEVQAYLNNPNVGILAQIATLEVKANRGLRDATLRQDSTFLNQYDAQIATLRSQLT